MTGNLVIRRYQTYGQDVSSLYPESGSAMGWIEDWRQRRKEKAAIRAEKRSSASALEHHIDQVVRHFDPVIHTIRGYRKQLREPVRRAVDHVGAVIDAVEGPIGLSPDHWPKDPLLKAMFVDAQSIRNLLRQTADIKSLFRGESTDQLVALLTATRKEKTVFTAAMEGGIVKRDVAQTAVEFTDHRIVTPTLSEADSRHDLKDQALSIIARRALEEVTSLKSWKSELTEQSNALSAQLHLFRRPAVELDSFSSDPAASPTRESEARQLLRDIDTKLKELSQTLSTPEDYLRHLIRYLDHSDTVITVERLTLRLNWMGVKLRADAPEADAPVTLAEMDFKSRGKRVAVLVTLLRRDILGV